MPKPICSVKRAQIYSKALFLVGLACLLFYGVYWPNVMLILGLPLSMKKFLIGRGRDALLTLSVFVGVFIVAQFNIPWNILLPVFLIMAALYLVCSDLIEPLLTSEFEQEKEIEQQFQDKDL